MMTLIIVSTFCFVPFILGACVTASFYPAEAYCPDDEIVVPPSPPALDSFACLEADLLMEGIALVGLVPAPSGQAVLLDDRDPSVDVNVEGFNLGCENSGCPMQMVFVIDDAYVDHCNARDGLVDETVVEYTDAGQTEVLVFGEEATDEDILSLLSPPTEELFLSMEPLDPEAFVQPTEAELPSVDEWLEQEEARLFCLAATELH